MVVLMESSQRKYKITLEIPLTIHFKRFAVVASIAGAGLEVGVVIIMGFASLFAVCINSLFLFLLLI